MRMEEAASSSPVVGGSSKGNWPTVSIAAQSGLPTVRASSRRIPFRRREVQRYERELCLRCPRVRPACEHFRIESPRRADQRRATCRPKTPRQTAASTYTRARALLRYGFKGGGFAHAVALHADNLFDREYTDESNWLSEPRRFRVSYEFSF